MRSEVLSAFVLFAAPLLAQRVPEVEPNDTPAQAQPIAVGTQIDAYLVAGEQDWYSFTLPSATRIRVHTSIHSFYGTLIALTDSTGTTYLAIDEIGRGNNAGYASDLMLNVAAGSYKIQVVGAFASDTGAYSLDLASITPMVYDGAEVEPNDTYLTATPTGVLGSGGKRFFGSLAANTVVFSDAVVVPTTPPVVFSGQAAASTVVYGPGTVLASPASTTTVIQSNALQPMANPPLPSYSPGMSLLFTSGANAGQSRLISTNTGFTITVATAFPSVPAGGDTYQIVTTSSTTVSWVNSLPLAGLYSQAGYSMRMTSGANVGLSRQISDNTGPSGFGSALTTVAFPVANAPGDAFAIDCIGSASVFSTRTPLSAGVWNPTTGLTTNPLGHFVVRFTSGVNVGLVRPIAGNTTRSITLVGGSLPAAPATNDTYVVEHCDTDYWQIVLTAPYTSIWLQIDEADAPWVSGYQYELYDASGIALLPESSNNVPSFGSQREMVYVGRTSSIRVWPAGTYYIAVRTRGFVFPTLPTMPNGVVPTGNYSLEIFTMPMDTGGVVTESEPPGGPNSNHTPATAIPIAPGQVGRGNITSSNGTDPSDWWGPVAINGPVTITCQTRRGATATPLLGCTLNLRDSAGFLMQSGGNILINPGGNLLDVPSGSSSVAHTRMTVSFFIPAGNVYFEVTTPSVGPNLSGDYEIELSSIIPVPYVTASYTTFLTNRTCGSAPFPTLTRQFSNEVPALGSTFSRQLTGCPASSLFFLMQGRSTTTANGGTTPLPFDLTPLGAPHCTVNVDPVASMLGVTDAMGNAELTFFVPGNVALRGSYWFEQALVLNPAANTLGVQVSNFGRPIFGERSY